MRQKSKRRPLFWVMICVLVILILVAVAVIFNLPEPQPVSDSSYNLSAIADGVYHGECDNGLVIVKLEVEVKNHRIADVHILEHDNGLGKAAEAIVYSVTSSQSIEVEAVSGATFSSQTILKAVENALSQ